MVYRCRDFIITHFHFFTLFCFPCALFSNCIPATITFLLQENRIALESIGFDVTAQRKKGTAKKGIEIGESN